MSCRSSSKLSSRELSQVYDLYSKQDWLTSREKSLIKLLSDCNNSREKELLFSLLERFTYLKCEEYQASVRNIIQHIIHTPNINENNTQVLCLANDPEADSSHYFIYLYKFYFKEAGWWKIKPLVRPKSVIKRASNQPNIFIIDEFVGSGITALNRLNHLKSSLESKGITLFSIKLCVIAAMNHGLAKVKNGHFEVYANHILTKGITDHYSHSALSEALNDMFRLESSLMPSINGADLPSLGYKKSESLFGRDTGIAPNNVFPIFWWRQYVDASERTPLLLGSI